MSREWFRRASEAASDAAAAEELMRSILKLFADGRLTYRKRELAQAPIEAKVARVRRLRGRPITCVMRAGFVCSEATPCCDRRDEYNGYGSDGPLFFRCARPHGCACHD